VKTDGIPGTSCRLKPDLTLSEFLFLFRDAADGFEKTICLWLGVEVRCDEEKLK